MAVVQRSLLVLAVAFAFGVTPLALSADERKFDSWETPDQQGRLSDLTQDCVPVGSRFVEVPKAQRQEAIALLEKVQVLKLDSATLARLIPGQVFDMRKVAEQEAAARERAANDNEKRAAEAAQHGGSGSDPSDRAYLLLEAAKDRYFAALNRFAAGHLKPYLVRAVALNEFTGGFGLDECGRTLLVGHGSLGRSWPTPQRRPLVAFLADDPDEEIVSTSMAE